MSFDTALTFTLGVEGGWSDHPDDRGGQTNYGITQNTYNAYRFRMKKPEQSVRLITKQEVEQIYEQDYWRPARCNELPPNLAVAHFDAAVNHGVRNANKLLQRAAGVEDDGVFGKMTLKAVQGASEGALLIAYLTERQKFYDAIIAHDSTQAKFKDGWKNRLAKLENYTGVA